MTGKNSFIAELIQHREDLQIEFHAEYDLNKLLKTICAFLNADGGWIMVGHSGDHVFGIAEDIEGKITGLKAGINEMIVPQPLVYVVEDHYKDKNLLLVNVLRGSRQPYSFNGSYFIRKRSASVMADPDEISLLLRKPDEFTSGWEKLTAIDVTMNDLDQPEIRRTITKANEIGRGKNLPDNPENFLAYFQLFDMSSVKNGSVVLFGTEPAKFLPQCKIRITVMPHGKTGSRYDDSLIIEDHLFNAFESVHNYFKKQIPVESGFRHDDWNRTDRLQYPLEALDEAVVNALVHRDYGDVSGEISINIYKDKIEITNSGEIPDGILKGKSSFELYHAVFRNPMISQLFFIRGLMERMGRGLLMIKTRFAEYGLKAPEWNVQNGYTSLTLYGLPKQIPISSRMVGYLKKLRTSEQFSREDYEKFLDGSISEKTARLDLSKLVEGGWLTKVGEGPSTKYVRSNKELPDISG